MQSGGRLTRSGASCGIVWGTISGLLQLALNWKWGQKLGNPVDIVQALTPDDCYIDFDLAFWTVCSKLWLRYLLSKMVLPLSIYIFITQVKHFYSWGHLQILDTSWIMGKLRLRVLGKNKPTFIIWQLCTDEVTHCNLKGFNCLTMFLHEISAIWLFYGQCERLKS